MRSPPTGSSAGAADGGSGRPGQQEHAEQGAEQHSAGRCARCRTLLPGRAERVTDTCPVKLSRRAAALLVLAGAWPLLVWPNFVRVVATDERAFDGGLADRLPHGARDAGVVSMALGAALVGLGVRAWRRA
jgi:hypothetical protein